MASKMLESQNILKLSYLQAQIFDQLTKEWMEIRNNYKKNLSPETWIFPYFPSETQYHSPKTIW